MTLCRYLRWKGWYGARWDTPEELAEALSRDDTPYSCLHTCRPWGPDDGVAAPETCGEHRPCFVLSPRVPTTAPTS